MAKSYVSFDDVKARVSMEKLLTHYGLLDAQVQQKGDELILHCIFHQNDKTPSLKINTAKNIFNCFGCNRGGDVIGFVVLREGIATGDHDHDRREAALRMQAWFSLAPHRLKQPSRSAHKRKRSAATRPDENDISTRRRAPSSETPEPATEREAAAPINPPLTFSSQHLDAGHPYLKARGLTDEVITTFGLGYFGGKGSMHGRIVIPVYDAAGQLVAYAGRWPGDPPEGEPKYKLPANFSKSSVLFNFHRAREHAREGLIVVEGFFSVFELWQKGRRNVVAVMGNHLSKEQEQLIVGAVGEKGASSSRLTMTRQAGLVPTMRRPASFLTSLSAP